MPDPAEREDLEALVQSAGWALFAAHAQTAWQGEFDRRVTEAIGAKALTPDAMQIAHLRLQQAAAIREELRGLLAWPAKRSAELARQERERVPDLMARRGQGL